MICRFNHVCIPNCIKYQPVGGGPSEVRACRWIAKGEALTLSYLEPREQSRRHRSEQIWQQFRFRCSCDLCSPRCEPAVSQALSALGKDALVAYISAASTEKLDSGLGGGLEGADREVVLVVALEAQKRLAEKFATDQIAATTSVSVDETFSTPADQDAQLRGQEAQAAALVAAWCCASAEAGAEAEVEAEIHDALDAAEGEVAALALVADDEQGDDHAAFAAGPAAATSWVKSRGRGGRRGKKQSSKRTEKVEDRALGVVERCTGLQHMASRVLGDAHPLNSRALRLVADAAAAAIAALERSVKMAVGSEATGAADEAGATSGESGHGGGGGTKAATPPMAPPQFQAVCELFVSACTALRDSQEGTLGLDHPDLARTYNDLSNGLRLLLRVGPESFALAHCGTTSERKLGLGSEEWPSAAVAATAEQRERRKHERIRALYAGR